MTAPFPPLPRGRKALFAFWAGHAVGWHAGFIAGRWAAEREQREQAGKLRRHIQQNRREGSS